MNNSHKSSNDENYHESSQTCLNNDILDLNKDIQIKICGITRKSDLKVAETAGADLIGFINVKRSKRFISLEKIKHLLNYLDDKNKAVLVSEPKNSAEVLDKIEKTNIKNVQLHSLDSEQIKTIKTEKVIKVIRAIGISEEITEDKKTEIESFSRVCDGILFDYQLNGKSGGTGKQIPLNIALNAVKIARCAAERADNQIEIFLAGGMDLDRLGNEGKIIKEYFDVVDFNSSLEDSPGEKNESKIKMVLDEIKKLNGN